MTSGEGQQGNPQGQPPQGQQPGPPPHGQPGPYGPPSQPPYGAQPYGQPYGYGPMPSAGYGQPPPEPKERPLTVRAGLGAFTASFLLGLGSSILNAINPPDTLPFPTDPQFEQQTGIDPEAFSEAAQEGSVVASLVFGILFAGLYLLFIWFAWKGHNWARIVLWVLGGLSLAFSPFTFGLLGELLPASQVALLFFQLLAVLVGVVLLAMRPSNEWYAHEKRRRAMTGPR